MTPWYKFSLIGNITQACCHLLWDRCKLSIVEKINNSCFCLSCGPSSQPTCDLLAPSLVFHTIALLLVTYRIIDLLLQMPFFVSQKNQHSEQECHHAYKRVIFFFSIQQQKYTLEVDGKQKLKTETT